MTEILGTLDELPEDYRQALATQSLAPLWPNLRELLPAGTPKPVTQVGHWPYATLLPLLLRAGELTPVEKAERRVLVLSDPGRGDGVMQATSTLYLGMQLLLPNEVAPSHVHTPSAVRLVVEGEGGYTVVRGEKQPMEPGDIVLTPGGLWHDHGHEGDEPVVWLDILDLPLFVYLEGSYANPGPLQDQLPRVDTSQAEYAAAGLVPSRTCQRAPLYPQLRFPWSRTESALRALAATTGTSAELDYVNPETGQDVLPTLGLTAMYLPAGTTLAPPLRSTSAAFHVVGGAGTSVINGREVNWTDKDTFSAPVFASMTHTAVTDTFLIRVEDRPLQQKLGFYEERPQ